MSPRQLSFHVFRGMIFLFLFRGQLFVKGQTQTILTLNNPLQVNQLVSLQYYKFVVPDNNLAYTIRVNFTNKQIAKYYPLLLVKNNLPPTIVENNDKAWITDYYLLDWNSHVQNKNFHQIQLTSQIVKHFSDPAWYFGVFIGIGSSSNYSIEAVTGLACPSDCNGHTCNQGVCDCGNSFIDSDCSVPANQLFLNQTSQFVIQNGVSTYFFMKSNILPDKYGILFTLSCEPFDGYFEIYHGAEGQTQTEIPLNYSNQSVNKYSINKYQMFVGSIYLYLSNGEPATQYFLLYFKMNNITSAQVTITTQQQPDSLYEEARGDVNMMSTQIQQLIIVLVSIGIMLSLCLICYCVVQIRRQNQAMQQQNQQRLLSSQQTSLTIEQINKYMPVQGYEEYRAAQEAQGKALDPGPMSCCICLLEFEANSQIRNTICSHIFHQDCICQWFSKHNNCPFCRRNMVIQELEKWISEQQKITKIESKEKQHRKIKFRIQEPEMKTEQIKLQDIGLQQVSARVVDIRSQNRQNNADSNPDPQSHPENQESEHQQIVI